jgi:hypothetical protein
MRCLNIEPEQRGQPGFVKMMPRGTPSSTFYLADGSFANANDAAGGIWVATGGAVQRELFAANYVAEAPDAFAP